MPHLKKQNKSSPVIHSSLLSSTKTFLFQQSKVCHSYPGLDPTTWLQLPDIPIPFHFCIYEADITAISNNIESQFVAHDRHITYRYYFLYFKYGQMKTIHSPISLQSLNLDMVVANTALLLGPSIHIALNFCHNDQRYSLFWNTDSTATYLRGMIT